MTEAVAVSREALERVTGIIPEDVIEKWIENKEIEVKDNDE